MILTLGAGGSSGTKAMLEPHSRIASGVGECDPGHRWVERTTNRRSIGARADSPAAAERPNKKIVATREELGVVIVT